MNGDGSDDLVIEVQLAGDPFPSRCSESPSLTVCTNAGLLPAVHVLYGGSNGLDSSGGQYFSVTDLGPDLTVLGGLALSACQQRWSR